MDYTFEWNIEKELQNIAKHHVNFVEAIEAFADPNVIHLEDIKHSLDENRFYAVGKTKTGKVITVRYAVHGKIIRIFGAANWRKWRKFYEKENSGPK